MVYMLPKIIKLKNNMNKKIAIRGHATRGKEVIELLEMMGGINDEGHSGTNTWKDVYYYLDNGHIRAYDWCDGIKFTLEGFWEKYPYKVDDKVVYEDDNDIVVISEIKWDNNVGDIFYNVKRIDEDDCFLCPPELLKPYKKTNINMKEDKVESTGFMQMGKIVSVIFNSANYEDEVELQLGDYEIVVRDGKTYAVNKKPKYPTTYAECCKILDIREEKNYTQGYKCGLFCKFQELFIARNAYWKIAGEEMGLGKPWEPSWQKTEENKFCIIRRSDNVVTKWQTKTIVRFLAFPTKEMRDAFFENFKELIEQCKEIL